MELSEHEVKESARLLATAYRDETPSEPTGAAPVAQPGRPPMSQWAVNASTVMLAGGAASVPASLALWALSLVDPVTLALAVGAPAVTVLAIARLVRSVGTASKDAGPSTVNHNYSAPVTHTTNAPSSTSRTVFGKASSKNDTAR